MNFFGIQLNIDEDCQTVAELVLRKAEELGYRCKSLELLDTLEIGTARYVRFRVDLNVRVIQNLGDFLHETSGRGVILPGGAEGYSCRMRGGRAGTIPFAKMQATSFGHPKVYRGNGIVNWERQFLKGA